MCAVKSLLGRYLCVVLWGRVWLEVDLLVEGVVPMVAVLRRSSFYSCVAVFFSFFFTCRVRGGALEFLVVRRPFFPLLSRTTFAVETSTIR